MSLRTLSQNKLSTKRYNITDAIYANYWLSTISGATISSPGNRAVAIDSTGAIYIVINTSLGTGGVDSSIIKYNTSGGVIWQKAFGSSGNNEIALSIDVNPLTNNIYLLSYVSGSSPRVQYVTSYDANGNLNWQKSIIQSNNNSSISNMCYDYVNDRVLLTGVWYNPTVVGGYTYTYGNLAILYNDGTLYATKTFGGGADYSASGLMDATVDGSGTIYLCGYGNIGSSGGNHLFYKFTAPNTRVWSYAYYSGYSNCIRTDSIGYIYVYGTWSATNNRADAKPTLFKFDGSGNVVWARRLNQICTSTSMAIDSSNNIFTIFTYTGGDSSNDVFIIKYDPDGTILWKRVIRSNSVVSDLAAGIITDSAGDFYISISDATNSKQSLLHLPGDGSLTGGPYGGYYYESTTSVTDSSLSVALTSISGTTAGNASTPSIATTSLASQSVSHTFTNTPISL